MTPLLRSFAIILLGLLAVGIARSSLSKASQMPVSVYSATVNRDCAPWDGTAFTVSIPVEGSVVNISIYQSPEINHMAVFSFPDKMGNTGSASFLPQIGSPEPLTGKVTFQRVEPGNPVEGVFQMKTSRGKEFQGKFIAQWENEMIYCG
jgi:hypothetical protein